MSTRALRSAASGMYAQQLNIEVISNNIANINTNAFKKNKAEFQDLMYQEIPVNTLPSTSSAPNQSAIEKIQVGNGVQPTSTQKNFKQGDIEATNNSMDFAIQGDGFFQVKKPDGTYAYTRDGALKVNSEGKIVTASGYYLEPEITITEDTTDIAVNRDGTVELKQVGGGSTTVDTIQLVRFMNPGGLEAIGNNLYVESVASGTPIYGTAGSNGFGEIQQGHLEASNVDIVEEMVAMIAAQRAYEINSKTVKTVEDMMTMANNLKRT